jgi:META domain
MTRHGPVLGAVAAILVLLTCLTSIAAEPFPSDRELLLEAAPMRPGKRMPLLSVDPNGSARIDLWCRTVPARIEISESAMKIEAGPLPGGQPEMMSAGQCTPERMQADEELLQALSQVTGWHWDSEDLVLEGPKPLRFRSSDH